MLSFSLLGQQGEKGNSIIPFPRVGRANGNSMSPGLIPYPRIGRDGSGEYRNMVHCFPYTIYIQIVE